MAACGKYARGVPRVVAALGVVACFALTQAAAAPATSAATELRVEVSEELLNLEARDVPLARILKEVARRAGFRIRIRGVLDTKMSWSLRRLPVGDGLRRILGNRSYVLLYDETVAAGARPRVRELHVYGDDGGGGKAGDRPRRSSGTATATPIPARITDDLDHADRARRLRAVRALGRYPGAASRGRLAAVLSGDGDMMVRRTAAIVLGNSRNPGAGEALLQALKDSQARVRIEAVRALGRTRPAGARAALVAVEANDTDRRVRRWARRTLDALDKESKP